ncbi:putative movement protein [Epirus cherry virus]|uniref:Putative movement protein n=1 Tax=Epirus cherry virus TaxID=544686 RepID=B3VMK9_9VIRU|nr:putative movement protein [Epirus cherry virus]ACF16358.1 putative movement protein [Epirus cherry virus]
MEPTGNNPTVNQPMPVVVAPSHSGQMRVDLSSLQIRPPPLEGKGRVVFVTEHSAYDGVRPLPLIPKDLAGQLRLKWHEKRYPHTYLAFEQIESEYFPHIPERSAYGELALVDTRYITDEVQDVDEEEMIDHLFSRALWKTPELDLGKGYKFVSAVPYCIPIHARGGQGPDLERDIPIRLVPRITRTDLHLASRSGTIKSALKVALSSEPIQYQRIESVSAQTLEARNSQITARGRRNLDRRPRGGPWPAMERSHSMRSDTQIPIEHAAPPGGGEPSRTIIMPAGAV